MAPGSRGALLAILALLAVTGTAVATVPTADPAMSADGSTMSTDGPAVAADNAAVTADGPAQQAAETGLDADTETEIGLTLEGDSDARWTITHTFNLTNEFDRDVFEELAADFEAGDAAQQTLATVRQEVIERVRPTVDREMEIEDVSRDSSLQDGTLELSFTWTNFAREDNETRIVDDVFTTQQGTWFDGLGPHQSLVIQLPRGSAIDTPKRVTDGTIRWDGPTEFEPGFLEISYTANPPPMIPPIVWGVLVALLVFGAVGLVAAYVLTRRDDGTVLPEMPFDRSGDTTDADTSAPAEPDEETEASTDAGDGDDGVDLSLLSDEERVEYLLERNGGRMKQANIVTETGWSNAKVSQLLSGMEEDGRIAKLRIGRENLISFPDEDIGDFEDH